jgi:steroid delta-isomerase-like uncharacterized protein
VRAGLGVTPLGQIVSREVSMSEDGSDNANIQVMSQAFDALNRHDLDACTAMMTPDFIINIAEMPYPRKGHAAWRQHAAVLISAFPDVKVSIEDIFASGDKIAVRVRLTGTHQGEFLGNRPTGGKIDYSSHEIYRFEDGKLAEEWICSDMMTLLTQVGAFSRGRLITMWLAGFRLWFGIAIGLIAGVVATAALMS